MAQRKNSALIAELCAAAVLMVAVKFGVRIPAVAAAFRTDKALMAHWQLWGAWAGWIIFSLYWEIAKSGSTEVKRAESGLSRGIHVFLANIGLLLVVAPILGLGRFMPIWPPVMAAGVVLETAGLAFAIWARLRLGRNWSGEITLKVDHQLIRTGPYRHLRHPIYTGLLAMFLGSVLVTGEWLAVLGLALGVFAYIRKLRLEEVNMDSAFGAEYDAYRRESWAIVPFLY
jgi:protein-S-isoprenylcysteine O-methyltransferase Ste14